MRFIVHIYRSHFGRGWYMPTIRPACKGESLRSICDGSDWDDLFAVINLSEADGKRLVELCKESKFGLLPCPMPSLPDELSYRPWWRRLVGPAVRANISGIIAAARERLAAEAAWGEED